MLKLDASDPEVMRDVQGGGCMMLFGLPFFLVGCGVILGTLASALGEGDFMPVFFGIPFGGIFAAVGGGIMFGRAGTILDRRDGVATTWWGLLVPFSSKTHALKDYGVVSITHEVRRNKNSSYSVYPVRLVGGKERIGLGEPREPRAARQCAETVAKFLDLPVEDASSGTMVRREAGELDLSLREQMRNRGEDVEVPDAPTKMACTLRHEGAELVVEIPATGFRLQHGCSVGICMLVVGAFVGMFAVPIASEFLQDGDGGMRTGAVAIIAGGGLLVFSIPLLLTAIWAYLDANRHERVMATPERLRVERISVLGTKATEIPADELEEFFIGREAGKNQMFSGRPILARSDTTEIAFGAHLDDRERVYVHALLAAVLTA